MTGLFIAGLNRVMKKRIHFIHYDAGPGGIEVLLPLLIKNLTNYSIAVYVIRSKREGPNVYQDTDIRVTYGSENNFKAYWKIITYVFRNRKDLFHVYNIGPVVLFLLRIAGAKNIVYSLHGTIYWKTRIQKLVRSFMWVLALGRRIFFLANSEYTKNEFIRKINRKAVVRVLYNPIDCSRFFPGHTGKENGELLIIYTGRLAEGKNLSTWLEIANFLHQKIPDSRFELYGEGSLRPALDRQIAESGGSSYMQLKSYSGRIEEVYRKADLLLFLSERESFGNVVVESILSGTPVVTLPIPSMKEIFKDYPMFLLESGNQLKEQVYDKVKALHELKKLAGQARKNFADRFSLENHVRSLNQIYNSFE